MDRYQGLSNVIRQAIVDAWSEGQSDAAQTNNAVQIVCAVRRDMSAKQALKLVERFRIANPIHKS